MVEKKKGTLVILCLCVGLLVSGCSSNPSSAYNEGIAYFGAGDYLEAAESFEKAGDYLNAQTYALYAKGLVLYEQTLYDEAAPYFEQVQDFMYGEQRYYYCMGSQYESEGNYALAAEMFGHLNDFEDGTARYYYCKARNDELEGNHEQAMYSYISAGDYLDASSRLANIQWQMYEYAEELMAEGQYENALSLFSKLGDFGDSLTYMRICQDLTKQVAYDAADLLEQAGDLQGAYDAFSGLIGFSDAQDRVYKLETLLGIESSDIYE